MNRDLLVDDTSVQQFITREGSHAILPTAQAHPLPCLEAGKNRYRITVDIRSVRIPLLDRRDSYICFRFHDETGLTAMARNLSRPTSNFLSVFRFPTRRQEHKTNAAWCLDVIGHRGPQDRRRPKEGRRRRRSSTPVTCLVCLSLSGNRSTLLLG